MATVDTVPAAVSVPAEKNATLNEKPNISRPASPASVADSFKSTTSQTLPGETPASSADTTTDNLPKTWSPPTSGPQKTPIPYPSPSSKPSSQPILTPDQQEKYNVLLSAVSAWTTVPTTTAKNAPTSTITDHERMFLTRECLLRYLRATKWVVPSALKRLQSTLSWRREYGADTFTHDYISPENETGKQVQLGFDRDQRPCLYLNPGNQNTKMSDRQIHHLCYMLDHTIAMMPPGVESTALIISFAGAKAGTVPTVGQARAVLNILQNHNPERLGRALILETPWYVNTFFKLISGFIDPVTREKMKFNEDSKLYVPEEQLITREGGKCEFVYEHDIYWPEFGRLVAERREAYRARWEKGGKKVGEFEEYLRGGDVKCLRDTEGGGEKKAVAEQEAGVVEGVQKLKV